MGGKVLYTQIVSISEDYFGPAAQRFISRIALSHLHKPAENLTKNDMPELITWITLAANVMTDNTSAIEQYINRLKDLTQTRSKNGSSVRHHSHQN